MNGNGVLYVSKARVGDSWDLCYDGRRVPLAGYKALKGYLRDNFGGSGRRLKAVGLKNREIAPLERILEEA